MSITHEIIGEILQISGVLIVLLSQMWFAYRARKKYGSLKKAFFAMISIIRLTDDRITDYENLRKLPEEYLKKTFPEWWTLARYLHEDILITAIGLAVTLTGLVIALLPPAASILLVIALGLVGVLIAVLIEI